MNKVDKVEQHKLFYQYRMKQIKGNKFKFERSMGYFMKKIDRIGKERANTTDP